MVRSPLSFLLAILLPVLVSGQMLATRQDDSSASDLAAVAAELPTCGLECLEVGLVGSTCTDAACICADTALLQSVTVCVTLNCTVPDALVVKNVTNTACGVPVRNAGPAYDLLNIVLGSISGAVLLLRLGYKLIVTKSLASDDWWMLITILSGVAGTVMTSVGTIKSGLGRDIWTLTPQHITDFIYWFYHMEWTYFLNLALLKMSLLFFYLRIFPKKGIRIVLWATIGYNVLWGIVFILLAIFQCQPIDYYWTSWAGQTKGTCINSNAIGWANAITSIVLDIWMLAIPLWELRGLQLHLKKKIGVAIMFCTGTFVTVISIIRLQTLITFASSSNPTWDNLRVSQWSTIEINVGIICACMPTLRLILLKIFPSISSTTRSYGAKSSFGDRYNVSGSRAYRSQGGRGGGGGGGGGFGAQPSMGSRNGRPGITYQRSYAVHYDDAETSSQVHLRDLEPKGLEAQSHISECSA